jgi:hypothetical protein
MLGVLQVNLTVPGHTTSTKGVPVVITIGGIDTRVLYGDPTVISLT